MKTRLLILLALCAAMVVLGGVWHIAVARASANDAPPMANETLWTTFASPLKTPPLTHFDPSSRNVFVGEVVTFTNLTTGTEPIAYLWDFGDGVTSTLEGPTHTYNLPATYTVTLTATNDYGAGFWLDLVSVKALQRPVSVTIGGPVTGRIHTAHTFTATVSPLTTTQPITYLWQASGQPAVTHAGSDWHDSVTFTWTTPGPKAITITVSNVAGVVTGTRDIGISHLVYLPVVLRQHTLTPATPTDGDWRGTTNATGTFIVHDRSCGYSIPKAGTWAACAP